MAQKTRNGTVSRLSLPFVNPSGLALLGSTGFVGARGNQHYHGMSVECPAFVGSLAGIGSARGTQHCGAMLSQRANKVMFPALSSMLSCHFSGMPPLSVPPGPDEALKRGKDREQAVANLVKRTRRVIHGPYGIEAYNLEESGADFNPCCRSSLLWSHLCSLWCRGSPASRELESGSPQFDNAT